MSFVATGGGSGGHVYPALAIIHALRTASEANLKDDVLYIGTAKGVEASLVTRAGIPFASVRAGAVRGRGPLGLARSGVNIALGIAQAWRILGQFRPDAILNTGGYVSFPVVIAGWLKGIPSLIFLPDVEPGLAIRFLAHFARAVAVTSSRSKQFLPPSKVVETGYPVRAEFFSTNKEKAKASLHLDPKAKTLVVLGGSQGSSSLNRAVSRAMPELLVLCQVIHVCGANDEAWLKEMKESLPEALKGRYLLYSYIHEEFSTVLASGDLAVSRAGASVLGEFPAVGLPGVLVPYPYAGRHQEHNARVLQETGAAVILEDSRLDGLLPLVREILEDEPRLEAMSRRARSAAHPEAATHIARLLAVLASKNAHLEEIKTAEPRKNLS